jgi:hypothetical protein
MCRLSKPSQGVLDYSTMVEATIQNNKIELFGIGFHWSQRGRPFSMIWTPVRRRSWLFGFLHATSLLVLPSRRGSIVSGRFWQVVFLHHYLHALAGVGLGGWLPWWMDLRRSRLKRWCQIPLIWHATMFRMSHVPQAENVKMAAVGA